MMNFNLKTPCDGCMFRCDKKPEVSTRVAENVSVGLLSGQSMMCTHCDYDEDADTEHCAGAMIMLEKHERPNQIMRIGERLGLYKYENLDMRAPVYDTFGDFTLASMDTPTWSVEEYEETAEEYNLYLECHARKDRIPARKEKADPPVAQGGMVA